MPFQNSKRVVLSVDDDEVNQLVMASFLEGAGYSVVQAMNGPDCLSYFRKAFSDNVDERVPVPDVVLLDVMMPGMDGYQVCREIRARYPAYLCVIMVSSKMSKDDVIHGLKFGLANDYLVKPFDRAILSAKLESRVRLVDSVKALAAHHREEFCEGAYRPIFPLEASGLPAAAISFSSSSSAANVSQALGSLLAAESSKEIRVRGFVFGKCIISSQSCDQLLDFCAAFSKYPAISSCVCLVFTESSSAALLATACAESSVTHIGQIRATSDFLHLLETSGNRTHFSTKLHQADPFRSLLNALSSRSLVPDSLRDDCTTLLESRRSARVGNPDLASERTRSELLKEVLRLESAVNELKGGLAFEHANLDALMHRMDNAKRFKTTFANKLSLLDDL
jgi:CheY-like chemotaxis protein